MHKNGTVEEQKWLLRRKERDRESTRKGEEKEERERELATLAENLSRI